jgi:hypothetical protein
MKPFRLLVATLFAAASIGTASAAVIFTETTDAGNAIATAADTTALIGLSRIDGNLSLEPNQGPDFVDLFKVSTATGGKLRARTGSGFDPALIADPVLYLFDAMGVGIAMDDESGGAGQAFLQTADLLPGTYFLAIAFAGVEPLDGNGGSIFDAFGSLAVLSADPLASWLEAPFAFDPSTVGAYSIEFSVPIPGTLALALAGLLAGGVVVRRRIDV